MVYKVWHIIPTTTWQWRLVEICEEFGYVCVCDVFLRAVLFVCDGALMITPDGYIKHDGYNKVLWSALF